MGSRILMMAVSLAIANYFYEAIGPNDWSAALDRSFFQGVALFYVWLALKFDRGICISTLPSGAPTPH